MGPGIATLQHSGLLPIGGRPGNKVQWSGMKDMFTLSIKLCKQSLQHMEQRWHVLLTGVLVFGVLLAGTQWMLTHKMKMHMANSLMGIDINEQRVEELTQRMQAGDETALDEMMQEIITSSNRLDTMTTEDRNAFLEQKAEQAFQAFIPTTMLYASLAVVVFLLGASYFSIASLRKPTTVGAFLRQNFLHILPLFVFFFAIQLLYIVPEFMLIAVNASLSFPFVGLLCLILAGARLLLLPVLYIEKKQSFLSSTKESIALTKGKVLLIVREGMVATGCIGIALIVAALATNIVSIVSLSLQFLVHGILVQVALCAVTVYMILLSREVLKMKPKK